MRENTLLVGAVGIHLLLSTAHGITHSIIPVPIPAWQLGVVVGTLLVLPAVGITLVARGQGQAGTWLVLMGALAGFAFETVAHFVVVNPDHVTQTSSVAFEPTALASTLGTGVAAIVAAWSLRNQGQRSGSSVIESST